MPDLGYININCHDHGHQRVLIQADKKGLETLALLIGGAKHSGWANIEDENKREQIRVEKVDGP